MGWYTIAGASLNSVKDDYNGAGGVSAAAPARAASSASAAAAATPSTRCFSLEGTLNQVFVDKNGSDGFGFDTATWVQVSAVFRFGR